MRTSLQSKKITAPRNVTNGSGKEKLLYLKYTTEIIKSQMKRADLNMKHERYIIDEREVELLDKYEGTLSQTKDPHRYDTFDKETLAALCRLKDRSNDMFFKRYQAATEVIDMIAEQVGINPDNSGYWLYAPDYDDSSPILRRIEEWISRSGEKAQLKRRVQELEQENAILRTLIRR